MKAILLLLALTFGTQLASSQTVHGTYTNTWESPAGTLTYTLNLQKEGTFTFQFQRSYASAEPTTTETVEGNWQKKGKLLVLITDYSTQEDELVTQLNNSKARYVALSPRHPEFNSVKPYLKFYESEAFHASGMELHQQDTSVSTSH